MGMVSRFGAWIDLKFPDKVVVKDADYRLLVQKFDSFSKELSSQDIRIQNVCKEIVELAKLVTEIHTDVNKLKVSSAFSARGALHNLAAFPPISQPNAKQ